MINKCIILYYRFHYDPNCFCSYCVNKKGLIKSLQKLGYTVSIEKFNCDWDYFYPAEYHFDYAIAYQNKIFGEFMFEADKMPLKVVEFAETYFDYILCGSKFLYKTWLNSGVDKKFLIPASLGIDTNIFNIKNCLNNMYPDTFKFLSIGAWQHDHWQDRKGFRQLIKIFNKLFANNKKVMLIIKTNSNAPTNMETHNIKIIREKWSDKEMANLYKCCALNGAYVAPHKGEGFCLTPDTQIITAEGVKQIKNVSLNDRTLSAQGTLQGIYALMKHKHKGNIINFKIWGIPDKVKLTPEHLVYACTKNSFRNKSYDFTWVQCQDLRKGDIVTLPSIKQHYKNVVFDLSNFCKNFHFTYNNKYITTVWQYSPKEKRVSKLKIKRFIKLDEDLAKLLGWYIAEGDTGMLRTVGFSFHKKEKVYIKEVIYLMYKLFGLKPTIKNSKSSKGVSIHFSSKIVSYFFKSLCGKGAKNKRIPKELLFGEIQLLELCISRMFKGDGCESNHTYCTVSKQLAYNTQLACGRLDISAPINLNIRYRKYNTEDVFKIQHYTLCMNKFKSKHSRRIFKFNDLLCFRIRDAIKEEYSGYVYNLHTKPSETFCSGFLVHNCRPLLESLYCGCHIGTTGWSGVLDFLNINNATLFPYTFIKSTLYLSKFYSKNTQPNVAQVDAKAVEDWMLQAIKEKGINPNYEKSNKFSWDSVVIDLMSKIKRRL